MSSFTYRSIVGCAFGHTSIVAFLPPPSSPSTEGPTGTWYPPATRHFFDTQPSSVLIIIGYQVLKYWTNTLLKGGMYWKIRLPTWTRPLIEEKKTSHWALLAACCFCSYLLQSQPTQTAKFTDVQNETGDGKCIRKGVQSSNILSFCVETKSSFSPG